MAEVLGEARDVPRRGVPVTVASAYRLGYRVRRVRLRGYGRTWALLTPEAGCLPCCSLSVAWRTLYRLLTPED